MAIERVEDRQLLAAYDLSQYELHLPIPTLPGPPGETTYNYSGVAYLPDPAPATTGSFFIIENNFNGTNNNGAMHEYRYGFDGTGTYTLLQRTTGAPPAPRLVSMTGFDNAGTGLNEGDPEAIVWKGGNQFAFMRERVGIMHDFLIDVDGPDPGTAIDGDTNGAWMQEQAMGLVVSHPNRPSDSPTRDRVICATAA